MIVYRLLRDDLSNLDDYNGLLKEIANLYYNMYYKMFLCSDLLQKLVFWGFRNSRLRLFLISFQIVYGVSKMAK